MFTYSNYYSDIQIDLTKRGYDLTADNVLDSTHFETKEDAINDFLQGAFDNIYDLVVKYRGEQWADAYFTDMQSNSLTGEALVYKQKLQRAFIEQCIFIYDNGDTETTHFEGKYPYAPKAVNALWGNALNYGRG